MYNASRFTSIFCSQALWLLAVSCADNPAIEARDSDTLLPLCQPATCETLAKNCGKTPDGCGDTLECGDTCTNPGETCGGGGVASVCGDGVTLKITVKGDGKVESTPPGIVCSKHENHCSFPFPVNATVVLTYTAIGQAVFFAWGGDCAKQHACTVVMDKEHHVEASFNEFIFDSIYGYASDAFAFTDVNNDHFIDVVGGVSNVWVWENDRAGMLKDKKSLVAFPADSSPSDMEIVDLNLDNQFDIVAVADAKPAVVFMNKGDNTFTTTLLNSVAAETRSVLVKDFNDDRNLDIVIGYEATSGNPLLADTIYLGKGDGTFSGSSNISEDKDYTRYLDAGYINDDNILDLLVGNIWDPTKVYIGKGDGTFNAPYPVFKDHRGTFTAKLVDIDNDSDFDVVTSTLGDDRVYLNDGKGNFSFKGLITAVADNTWSIDLGDINGDGFIDAVAANWDGKLIWYQGNGDGTFKSGIAIEADAKLFELVKLIDFDNDGDLDLFVDTFGSGFSIYLWTQR